MEPLARDIPRYLWQGLYPVALPAVIRKWETAATTLNRQIIADATKDISTGSLAGFGIDGGEETAVDDALAVRGTVQQCGIIQELEKQQTEIKEKAGYWLHKLTL